MTALLMATDPAGEGGHEDLPGLKDGCHRAIVARRRSYRQLSLAAQVGLFFPGIRSAEKVEWPRARRLGSGATIEAKRSPAASVELPRRFPKRPRLDQDP